jgi:hypothetical protein
VSLLVRPATLTGVRAMWWSKIATKQGGRRGVVGEVAAQIATTSIVASSSGSEFISIGTEMI